MFTSSLPPPLSSDHVVCSNTEDTPPLSKIEPVVYSAIVRKNDTKVTVKTLTSVYKEELNNINNSNTLYIIQ